MHRSCLRKQTGLAAAVAMAVGACGMQMVSGSALVVAALARTAGAAVRVDARRIQASDLLPVFNYAVYSRGPITGSFWVNSYDGQLNPRPHFFNQSGADVVAGGPVTMLPCSIIFGNLSIFSSPRSSQAQVLHALAPSCDFIGGDLKANGLVMGAEGVDPANVEGAIMQSQGNEAPALMPVPAPPADARDLGALDISGAQTVTLTSGHYLARSIHIRDAGELHLDTRNGPVSIWVAGSGCDEGVRIAGLGLGAARPSDLRIWYDGSAPTIIDNTHLSAVIYAPNSDVTTNCPNFFGAVVCKSLKLNSHLHYDTSLRTDSSLRWQSNNGI